jgi:hypothetical protein
MRPKASKAFIAINAMWRVSQNEIDIANLWLNIPAIAVVNRDG